MDRLKQAQEVFNKAYDLVINDNNKDDLLPFFQALKRALKYGLQDGLDLNDTYTIMYCTNGDIDLFTGDITNHWEELINGNWNGTRYTSPKRNAEMFSTSLYNLMTQDNPGDINQVIEEVQPGFTPAQVQDSYILTLDDLIDDKGYLKVLMLQSRYLVRDDELEKLSDWIHALEDEEEDTKPSHRVMAMDILKDSYVDLLYTSDVLEEYINLGVEATRYYVLDNSLIDELYKEQVEGTGEGLIIKVGDRLIEVKFNNDDIRQYLDTQATGEELLDLYQAKEEEIDKHFIKEQLEEIIAQLEA